MAPENVLTRADLLAAGYTSRRITDAVRAGSIVRTRRDRYIAPQASAHIARATAVGGRLACVSALAALGIWTASEDVTHVQVAPHSSRQTPSAAVRLHWNDPHDLAGATAVCTSVFDALLQSARCVPFEMAVAGVDSALHLGLLPRHRLEQLRHALPRASRRIVDRADGRCESGTETLLRLALEDAGIPFALQVRVPTVGRVDVVVAGRIIVEVDSRRWHSGDVAVQRDHARDLAAARAGYVVLRLTYWQVLLEREACIEAIRALGAAVGAELRMKGSPRSHWARGSIRHDGRS